MSKTPYELFGNEVGKGWQPIVKEAIKKLEVIHSDNIKKYPEVVKERTSENCRFLEEGDAPIPARSFEDWYGKCIITQVKEKYGGLRIYTAYTSDEIKEIINQAEQECRETCEACGSKENVEQRGTHWYKNLCDKCEESYTG